MASTSVRNQPADSSKRLYQCSFAFRPPSSLLTASPKYKKNPVLSRSHICTFLGFGRALKNANSKRPRSTLLILSRVGRVETEMRKNQPSELAQPNFVKLSNYLHSGASRGRSLVTVANFDVTPLRIGRPNKKNHVLSASNSVLLLVLVEG